MNDAGTNRIVDGGAVPPRVQRRGRLFRKYVALFVAVVAIALLANGLLEIWFSYREHQESLVRIQHEQAEAAAAKIGQFIKEIESQLGWTTQLPWSSATLEQRRVDALRLLRQVPAITELTQLDSKGHEQLRVSRLAMDVVGSGADLSKEPKFAEAVAHKVYYGPVYFRRESEPYMTLSLAGTSRAVGVSVAEVNLKFIWDVVSQIKVGEHGQAFVVDRSGRLIAHPDISLVLRNPDLTSLAQVKAALAGSAGTSLAEAQEARDLRGHRVLSAHAKVELPGASTTTSAELGWNIFVELPREEAYGPLYASIERSAILLLGGLILAFLAGLLLARRMVVPIERLRAGAARLGRGELSERIAIKTGDELETLANQFNDMAGQLQESYADLERKIELRTQELARSVEELRTLGEVSQTVNSTLEIETVLQTIVAKAVQLSQTDAGAIYAFDETRQEFQLQATYGMDDALIDAIRHQRLGMDNPIAAEAARTRTPVQVSDLPEDPTQPVQNIIVRAGFRAVLVVPLLSPDGIVGALIVRRRESGTFASTTIDLLKTFAAQSVVAIQNARLFAEIEDKGRQLELASRHKSQFLANMSHELRTPLNAVLGYSEMMLDGLYGDMPEKAKGVLERVQNNGRHLLGLINDVLDLSKIEAGQLTLAMEDYSMAALVKQAVATTESLARTKRLALTAQVQDGLPLGRGDERRLTQVLLNLIGNAVKFTDKGEVAITAEAADGRFTVAVRDTGPGIAEADQARIFEEFQQVDDTSTRKKGGTGLGLAIAKRIMEMHGGTLTVQSNPGEGSTFRMILPVRAQHGKEAA
jgi:signal transduction histidine kinase